MRVVPAVVGVERNWSPSEPSRRTRTVAAAWSRTAGTGGSPGAASAGPRRFPTTLSTVPPTSPGRADPHRGSRRVVEEYFQRAQQECGLDDHQVRRCPSRRRPMTLAMAAHACPDRSARPPARHGQRRNGSSQLIHLGLAEIRRLIARLTDRHPTPADHILHRSAWRRRRRHRDRLRHYKQRGAARESCPAVRKHRRSAYRTSSDQSGLWFRLPRQCGFRFPQSGGPQITVHH